MKLCQNFYQPIEKIPERTLRFVYSDYCSLYSEQSGNLHVGIKTDSFYTHRDLQNHKQHRTRIHEQYSRPNQSHYSSRRPLNLFVPRINQTTYGLRSFRYQGTVLWNSLPEEIKTASNLSSFKKLIKSWEGPHCG